MGNRKTDRKLLKTLIFEFPGPSRQNSPVESRATRMSNDPRMIDLTQVPRVPFAWVDEHVYAAIRGCSVKVLQRERGLNVGCKFRRINGTTVRYKLGDITAFMESQPGR